MIKWIEFALFGRITLEDGTVTHKENPDDVLK